MESKRELKHNDNLRRNNKVFQFMENFIYAYLYT